jgi:hypothetical protein
LCCNIKNCAYEGKCISSSTIAEIVNLKTDFWGDKLKHAPAVNERREKIIDILTKAKQGDELKFSIGFGKKLRYVCEAGFLILLGLSTSKNYSDANSQWKRAKKFVMNEDNSVLDNKLFHKGEYRNEKFMNAVAYIIHIAKFFGDKVPVAGGENVTVLPYDDIKSFHAEYVRSREAALTPPFCIAQKSTFTTAFNSLDDIRLLGCKGMLTTRKLIVVYSFTIIYAMFIIIIIIIINIRKL